MTRPSLRRLGHTPFGCAPPALDGSFWLVSQRRVSYQMPSEPVRKIGLRHRSAVVLVLALDFDFPIAHEDDDEDEQNVVRELPHTPFAA
jgi:hypothetical protein